MKKAIILSLLFCLCLLSACGEKEEPAPDSISFTCEGEAVTVLDLLNGTVQEHVCAVLSPADFQGEIVWSSEDSGIVKISSISGAECTLTAKKTGSVRITAECGGVRAELRVHVLKDQNNLSAQETALHILDTRYSAEICNLYYVEQYYTFLKLNQDALDSYGLDPSRGFSSLNEQECSYSSDGTWFGYFLDATVEKIQQTAALCDYAAKNGIVLDTDEKAEIKQRMEQLKEDAGRAGFTSENEFLASYYTEGVTTELYRRYLEDTSLAEKTLNLFIASLSYTDEQLQTCYEGLGYGGDDFEYATTSMRHLLIKAEAGENGEYTEEAIQAAHTRAEELYAEWLKGDMTEESFAQLCDRYSEDPGSVGAGGYYGEIYKRQMITALDNWLFEEGRRIGDTILLDNNGSYVGTHIVYFSGYDKYYSLIVARTVLRNQDRDAFLAELAASFPVEYGRDFGAIGDL